MVEFGNLLNYTAMGVGNHDFDDSVDGLVPFAEQVEDYEKVEQTYLLPNLDQLSAAWSQHQLQPAQLHREQPLQQGGILQMQSLMIFHLFPSRQW